MPGADGAGGANLIDFPFQHAERKSMRARLSGLIVASALLGAGDATHAQVPSQRMVVQNYYFALPGKIQAVYELRLRASAVRASLGLPRGRVLRREQDKPGSAAAQLPDVVWECEYPSASAREQDVATLGHSEEFARVENQMNSLLRDFQRVVFTVSSD
jgi:hypothetical protein